jgi:hypothetical protein
LFGTTCGLAQKRPDGEQLPNGIAKNQKDSNRMAEIRNTAEITGNAPNAGIRSAGAND